MQEQVKHKLSPIAFFSLMMNLVGQLAQLAFANHPFRMIFTINFYSFSCFKPRGKSHCHREKPSNFERMYETWVSE
jgi:hypothetical protein